MLQFFYKEDHIDWNFEEKQTENSSFNYTEPNKGIHICFKKQIETVHNIFSIVNNIKMVLYYFL